MNLCCFSQFTTGTVNLTSAGMTVKIDTTPTTVTLKLTGDSNSMLGVGFNATAMADLPDGFIYNSGTNLDFKLNDHAIPTADVAQDWSVTSNTVAGSTRTIIATRSLIGGTGDFAFSNAAGTLNIIYARRAGNQALGYHGNLRDATTLTFSASLGVDEADALNKSFKIYPNPVKDILNIEFKNGINNISIYDVTGRKVVVEKPESRTLNISRLKSGVYFIEIETNDNLKLQEKFIKK